MSLLSKIEKEAQRPAVQTAAAPAAAGRKSVV